MTNNNHPAVETRKILKAKYGNKVSVRRDSGTAYGWVKVRLNAPRPEACTCEESGYYCEACKEEIRRINAEINELVKDVEFYTYCTDMGDDRREFMIDIDFE